MLTLRSHSQFFALIGLLISLVVSAADPEIYSHRKKGAIKGADTVAYWSLPADASAVIGSNEYTHEWSGTTWKFANAENLEKFIARPEAYAPEFGGYCAFAVSHNFTKPVDPDRWDIVDNKLYLNFNGKAHRKWRKNRDGAITQGHANWPNVLMSCEKHRNCRKSRS